MNNAFIFGIELPVVVAEIGVNHNGNLDTALKLIRKAGECGADAVKFQTFSADKIVSAASPKAPYQLRNTSSQQSQYDMLKALEVPESWYPAIKSLCSDLSLKFLSTPYDIADIALLRRVDVDAIKVPSAWAVEPEYLTAVAQAGKPVLLSTGMCTINEVADAVAILSAHTQEIILLQCTTNYPTAPEDCNVRVVKTLFETFGYPVGLSDHSQSHVPALLALALGACVIERHFTLDKNMPGPDHSSSDTPEEFAALVRQLRLARTVLGRQEKRPVGAELENITAMRRSFVAATPLAKGTAIQKEMLALKRPASGIEPKMAEVLTGSIVTQDIAAEKHITYAMVDMDSRNSLTLREIDLYSRGTLDAVFDEIVTGEDNKLFHPHPFTKEFAAHLSSYSGRDYYALAFCAKDVVGYAMLRGWDEGYAVPTVGLYICRKYRGRKFALPLLRQLRLEALQRGAVEMMAKVAVENIRSMRAFISAGFTTRREEKGIAYLYGPTN